MNKKFLFIPEGKKNRVVMATDQLTLIVIMERGDGKKKEINTEDSINLAEFIEVKGWKAIGNKIAGKEFVSVVLLHPNPEAEMEEGVKQDLQSEKIAGQMQLVNEELLKEEEEKIKRLLEDEPEVEKKVVPKIKNIKPDSNQSKLF